LLERIALHQRGQRGSGRAKRTGRGEGKRRGSEHGREGRSICLPVKGHASSNSEGEG